MKLALPLSWGGFQCGSASGSAGTQPTAPFMAEPRAGADTGGRGAGTSAARSRRRRVNVTLGDGRRRGPAEPARVRSNSFQVRLSPRSSNPPNFAVTPSRKTADFRWETLTVTPRRRCPAVIRPFDLGGLMTELRASSGSESFSSAKRLELAPISAVGAFRPDARRAPACGAIAAEPRSRIGAHAR